MQAHLLVQGPVVAETVWVQQGGCRVGRAAASQRPLWRFLVLQSVDNWCKPRLHDQGHVLLRVQRKWDRGERDRKDIIESLVFYCTCQNMMNGGTDGKTEREKHREVDGILSTMRQCCVQEMQTNVLSEMLMVTMATTKWHTALKHWIGASCFILFLHMPA